MFNGNCSGASGDIEYLMCQLTSQNHVAEGSSNSKSGSSSLYVTILPGVVVIDIVALKIYFLFVTC